MSLYEYVKSGPLGGLDPFGLNDKGDLFVTKEHFGHWKPMGDAKKELIDGSPPELRTAGGLGAIFYKGPNGPERGDYLGCGIEIEFEFKFIMTKNDDGSLSGGNSGLHVCIPDIPAGEKYDYRRHVVELGYEIQFQSTDRDTVNLQRASNYKDAVAKSKTEQAKKSRQQIVNENMAAVTGSIYEIKPPDDNAKAEVNDKDWNKMRVRLREDKGMEIKVSMSIGGKWQTLTTFNQQTDKALDVGKRGDTVPLEAPKRSPGDIAIQSHGGTDITAFRNIVWRKVKVTDQ
jgi:hypothetical protein